jgi:hypothetical protein
MKTATKTRPNVAGAVCTFPIHSLAAWPHANALRTLRTAEFPFSCVTFASLCGHSFMAVFLPAHPPTCRPAHGTVTVNAHLRPLVTTNKRFSHPAHPLRSSRPWRDIPDFSDRSPTVTRLSGTKIEICTCQKCAADVPLRTSIGSRQSRRLLHRFAHFCISLHIFAYFCKIRGVPHPLTMLFSCARGGVRD